MSEPTINDRIAYLEDEVRDQRKQLAELSRRAGWPQYGDRQWSN